MLNFKSKRNDEALDVTISDIFAKMQTLSETSDEYSKAADQLVKLMTLKNGTPSWRPSPDALIGAAASVLGILLILRYEKLDVVTSKALSFVTKTK